MPDPRSSTNPIIRASPPSAAPPRPRLGGGEVSTSSRSSLRPVPSSTTSGGRSSVPNSPANGRSSAVSTEATTRRSDSVESSSRAHSKADGAAVGGGGSGGGAGGGGGGSNRSLVSSRSRLSTRRGQHARNFNFFNCYLFGGGLARRGGLMAANALLFFWFVSDTVSPCIFLNISQVDPRRAGQLYLHENRFSCLDTSCTDSRQRVQM